MSGATQPHAELLTPAIGFFTGTTLLPSSPGQLGCSEPPEGGTQEGLSRPQPSEKVACPGPGRGRGGAAGGRRPLRTPRLLAPACGGWWGLGTVCKLVAGQAWGFTHIIAVITESGGQKSMRLCTFVSKKPQSTGRALPPAVTVPLAGCLDTAFPDLLSGSQRGSLPQTDKIERVSGGGADSAVPARCE